MPRRRSRVVGTTSPGGIVPPSGKNPNRLTFPARVTDVFDFGQGVLAPPGSVAFISADPPRVVVALLNEDGCRPTGGGPRNDVVERVLRTSVPEYKGHDPMRMAVSVIFDGYRQNRDVQPDIKQLYALGNLSTGRSRTPLIRLSGEGSLFQELRWTVDGEIQWDDTPEPIRNNDGFLIRQALTVNLLQRVPDSQLGVSIAKSRRSGAGARNGPHYTTVRGGENDLGDVSKRLYGTRSRAKDLAQANNLAVGSRLRRKQRIRVP